MKKFICIIVLCLSALSSFALTLNEQADSAYNKENYREAIALYQQSITTYGPSSTLWYNLGNAYFRNDNAGKAVLCYERALKLNPTNADARQNLEFVNSRIQDKPEDDTAFFSSMHHSIVTSASPNTWAWITFAVFVLLIAATALYIFAHSITLRKSGFFGGIILVFVCAYFLLVSSDAVDEATSNRYAVVTAPSTQLTSAPRAASGSDKVVTIHEGTKVEITDSVPTPDDPESKTWYNVKINNATKAWLRASDVERI